MALIFPSGIYSEGQGIFDSSPYIKLIEARKKAKEEAFTKYYDKLKTQINTAGVREIDLYDPNLDKGINKDIEKWTSYGIQNKNDIAKGGLAKLEFERMQREILNRVEQSKNVAKFETNLGQAFFANKYNPQDTDIDVQSRVANSIYNPKHYKESYFAESEGLPDYTEDKGTPWNWGDISSAVNTLKEEELKSFYNSAIGKEAEMKIDASAPIKKIGTDEIKVTKFDDATLKNGADRVMFDINPKPTDVISRRKNKTYSLKMDDPDWMAKADPLFQKFYGKPIENVKEAAAADFLLSMEPLRGERVVKPSTSGKGRKGGAGGADGKFYDAWSDLVTKFNKDVSAGSTYTQINTLPNNIVKEAVIAQANTGQQKVGGLYPYDETNLFIVSDGKDGLDIFTTINNPKLERNARTFVAHLTEEGTNNIANQSLGIKAKQQAIPTVSASKGNVPKTVKYPLPKGKPRTVKQGNFTYTWNENTGQYE
jgi:hypothetical protein